MRNCKDYAPPHAYPIIQSNYTLLEAEVNENELVTFKSADTLVQLLMNVLPMRKRQI